MLGKQLKYFCLFLIIVTVGCAKRGTINGGMKDTIAPVLKMSFPKNYTTNFTGNTIKLTFDEYIKLKDVSKQLIISPPMEKAPEIFPQTSSKFITVKIKDTLRPNTTYSLNFGQSIEDNNEGNPYKQFKYIFSTGPFIDSLSVSGSIKDAHNLKTDQFVTIMLYEVDEKYNDSVVYKKAPRYVTHTLDSVKTFKLENLKAGKYKMVALKDNNSNYRYNPKTEKIGFRKALITIPTDSVYQIALFEEAIPFKAFKPSQASANRAIAGYEGNPEAAKFQLKKGAENLQTIVTKVPQKDSLHLWFKPVAVEKNKTDSLSLAVTKNGYSENFTFKIKNQKKDSLTVDPKSKKILPLGEKYTLTSNVPLTTFDVSKMKLTNKDSLAVKFTTEYDEMNMDLSFIFPKEQAEKYKLVLMKGALTDFLGQTNDTLTYNFETKNTSDYGNLKVLLENVKQFPIIVELTNKNEEVRYSVYSESSSEIDFNLIEPDIYTLRVIYDENKNKQWDAGNFLRQQQSEEVIYFPKGIDVRANWDVVQPFNLK